jgi:hypothetical protein
MPPAPSWGTLRRFIHRSAWKGYSPKCVEQEFSEVWGQQATHQTRLQALESGMAAPLRGPNAATW